jgi:hypothetical protein
MVLRLKKLADRSGSSAALHRFIGHILLSVLSGNTCVLPTLSTVVRWAETAQKSAPENFFVSAQNRECFSPIMHHILLSQ